MEQCNAIFISSATISKLNTNITNNKVKTDVSKAYQIPCQANKFARWSNFNHKLRCFNDSKKEKLVFASSLSASDRWYIHKLAKKLGLLHASSGAPPHRFITVTKPKTLQNHSNVLDYSISSEMFPRCNFFLLPNELLVRVVGYLSLWSVFSVLLVNQMTYTFILNQTHEEEIWHLMWIRQRWLGGQTRRLEKKKKKRKSRRRSSNIFTVEERNTKDTVGFWEIILNHNGKKTVDWRLTYRNRYIFEYGAQKNCHTKLINQKIQNMTLRKKKNLRKFNRNSRRYLCEVCRLCYLPQENTSQSCHYHPGTLKHGKCCVCICHKGNRRRRKTINEKHQCTDCIYIWSCCDEEANNVGIIEGLVHQGCRTSKHYAKS